MGKAKLSPEEVKRRADRAERTQRDKPNGRPSDYTPEIAAQICDMISEGLSLRLICSDSTMPDKSTVFRWLGAHESFRDQYAFARELQAELNAEEIVDISDNKEGDVQRDRLRVDARKWVASKLLPKKYGDRVTQELTGKDGGPIETKDVSARDKAKAVAALLAAGLKSGE